MRKIISVFLMFILITLIFIPVAYSATEEGYGEANDNLGQFTDSFENNDNISVAYQVINNVTLECMELGYTNESTVLYNLTSLREHDVYGGSRFVSVTFTIVNNDELRMVIGGSGDGYMFIIADSAWLDDKYVRFRYYPYASEGLSGYQTQKFEVYDGTYDRSSDVDFPTGGSPPLKGNGQLFTYQNVDGLNAWFTKDFQVDTSGGSETNVTIWWKAHDGWSATAIGLYLDWIEINEGAGGTDNILTINYNNSSPITMEKTATEGDYGFSFNPELPYQTGGYYVDGYFITEDYLNYTTGNSLTLLTNASIPEGTLVTIQFSNDNVTWVDNEGNVGSTTIKEGFYAIDLRDLNYTDDYKMVNFTGTPSLTPRLYQLREVTTNGTANGGGVTNINSLFLIPTFAIIGLICLIAILLRGRK